MSDRVHFFEHAGKQVLLIDLKDAPASEITTLLTEVQNTVAEQPRDSVLILADFCGAEIDKDVANRIKQVLVLDRPFVKRAAWVGTETLPKVFYENFKSFSRREFPTFKDREAALAWLVTEP
jgi:hypothetical protein